MVDKIFSKKLKVIQLIVLDVDGVFNGWFVKSNAVVLDGHQRSAYELIFTAPSELAEGPFSQIFQFKTNLPDAPPVKLMFKGLLIMSARLYKNLTLLINNN